MKEEYKKMLSSIETDLYFGIGENGSKSERAEKIILSVKLAYEEELSKVSEDLREFAQTAKNHWPELQDLKLEDQKKYLQKQVHGLLETLK